MVSADNQVTQCDFDRTMELCQLAGKIMLFAGGETYRVEDTVIRIARACGMEAESFVTPTGIFITLNYGNKSHTAMTRIMYRTIDLNKVSMVNGVSRDLSVGLITPEEAQQQLKEISIAPLTYTATINNIAAGVAGGSFAYLFGGTYLDVLAAGIIGVIVNIVLNYFLNRQTAIFLATFIAAVHAALVAFIAVSVVEGTQVDKIIIGGIMPLLPGVALTNAVRDMIAGDLVSGLARGAEAVLIASAIAAGVIVVLALAL